MILRIFMTDDEIVDFPFSNAEMAARAIHRLVTSSPTPTGLVEISSPAEIGGAVPLAKIRFIRLVPSQDPIITFAQALSGAEDEVELPGKNNER